MVKKIFLTFLLLGFIIGPLAATEKARAISGSEIQEMASSAQESIKKDVLPGWQQYFQTIKDFISEQIKAVDINKIAGGIKDEFNREVVEFKTDLPGAFKEMFDWFKNFHDNWLKKP